MKASVDYVNIIGAGLAGLSAGIALAKKGCHVRLFSVQASERAQSNLAEGGINAALDVMGEADSISEHYNDTMKGGCYIASPKMVKGLTAAAPAIIKELEELGVPFHRENGHIIQRNFGGQKKKRTAYAKSSTGKVLTVALINEARKYEDEGFIERFCHHRFEKLILDDEGKKCLGVQIKDIYTDTQQVYVGLTIMACGGLNGFFEGLTTGTTANTASAAAVIYSQGVEFANLEFIQYHPTTVEITGKRMLISEAARGEGGRLFVKNGDGRRSYFMEEKYGKNGNLMPRDIISKEMAALDSQAYLDLTVISDATWENKLSDMRQEIIHYLGIDPKISPVPVSPGIHYFMGGIFVDERHSTNISGLYAAGECAAAYHGANRLGGNSLLAAIYGGKVSADSVYTDMLQLGEGWDKAKIDVTEFSYIDEVELSCEKSMQMHLIKAMGVMRDEKTLANAFDEIEKLKNDNHSIEMTARIEFALAMIKSAMFRKETRGAQVRLDFPDTDDKFTKTTKALFVCGKTQISYSDID